MTPQMGPQFTPVAQHPGQKIVYSIRGLSSWPASPPKTHLIGLANFPIFNRPTQSVRNLMHFQEVDQFFFSLLP